MIEMTRGGVIVRVSSEDQAKVWESYGYRRVKPKKAAKKADEADEK